MPARAETRAAVCMAIPPRVGQASDHGLGPALIHRADVMLTRGYSGARAYCQSKLAQIMFTIDLADELAGTGVVVNALHPATYMNTTMVRRAGVTPISSVEQGAEAILNLAASPDLAGRTGRYFNGLREARADAQAYDAAARRRLKAISLELTGALRPPEAYPRWISSIDTFCGAVRNAIRTPGRIVFGSMVNATPLPFSSATAASTLSTVSPMCSSPIYGICGGAPVAAGSALAMKIF